MKILLMTETIRDQFETLRESQRGHIIANLGSINYSR